MESHDKLERVSSYKELFDIVSVDIKEPIELEKLYSTDKIQVKTPKGEWVNILGMIKKTGTSVKIATESGETFHGEEHHAIKSGSGEWVYLKDCNDVLFEDGRIEKVVDKTWTNETEFYDISIPPPHEYVSPNGLIHHNTFVVTQTLKKEGLTKGKGWYLVKGKISTSALYQMLFMHRKDDILCFDDTDNIWKDQEAANILKAALDSGDERIISWVSPRTTNVSLLSDAEKEKINDEIDIKFRSEPEGTHKLPSEFEYQGRIIFISNLTYDKFDSAVLTRSAKIDMTLTRDQMFMRMESILAEMGDSSVPLSTKKEILGFLRTQSDIGALSDVSMRTYVAAEDLYKSGLPNWKELLDYV